ncbi:MAG: phosphotransferase enzyme family protein [Planctomycetota bacterium]|jgi:Ser/Thr protein kinase RdoA (MazF antagonist)
MPRGGAHFSSEELVRVLSHYDIGVILHLKPLSGGNKRAPKMVVVSEQGKFLLKRRPKGKDDLYRVAFAHSVQSHLAKVAFPVTSLLTTRDENNTILQLNNHIYEFFKFVTGVRYDGSSEATVDTGRQLADFHRHLADFAHEWQPLKASFHDSSTVRRHLKTIGSDRMAKPSRKLQATAEELMVLYNESSIQVNELGFDSWDQQVVHGDWHPGNMLFSEHKVAVVLDFDSIKIAPPITDLANGMLQFSIVGGRPNPADWPDYFNQDKLLQFLNGYKRVAFRKPPLLDKNKLQSLLDLMIETMIAEAVLPIAATGFFGHLSGLDFLQMIRRKAQWLNKNRNKLTRTICGE